MADIGADSPSKPVSVVGSYRLLAPLGSGGMSSVFRAVHIESGHIVAVKVLPRVLAHKSTMLQRFLREAKSAEALEHPNIVAIYDRGVDQGRHYLVLEYVDGKDLHDHVQENGPMPAAQAVGLVRQAAAALRHAAARGIIHRDIKPANLLIDREGQLKIIDLGLALQAEEEDERVTRDGTTVGTVDYMAPEQARDSRATGIASDIYSLGCTFFYLLTGSAPYPGGDIADKLRRHASVPAPDARQYRADVPENVSRLIRRMMAKRPERRFPDYEELIAEIDSLRVGPASSDETGIRPALVAEPAPPVALIDDEDEEEDLAPLVPNQAPPTPPVALIDDEGLPDEIALMPEDGPLMTLAGPSGAVLPPVALIDDDDEDDRPPPKPPPKRPASGPTSSGTTRARPSEVKRPPSRSHTGLDLADLAALAEAVAPPPQRPVSSGTTPARPPSKTVVRPPSRPAANLGPAPLRPSSTQVPRAPEPVAARAPSSVEEAHFEPVAPEIVPAIAPPAEDAGVKRKPVRDVVLGGLAAAVLFVLVFVVVRVALFPSGPGDDQNELTAGSETGPEPEPAPRIVPKGPSSTKAVQPAPPPVVATWVEPVEETTSPKPEFALPTEWERKFTPTHLAPATGNVVAVRRVGPVEGRGSVVAALDVGLHDPQAVLELADNGPFFESDLRVLGKNRLVRARPGFRPIVFVDPPQLNDVKEQTASTILSGARLTLEGLDIVVKVGRLTSAQTALFQVRGGGLALRDCTITVLGPSPRAYSVIDVEAPESGGQARSNIEVERTLIRGAIASVVRLGAPADVHIERSALLAGNGVIVSAVGLANADQPRAFDLLRSVTASTGPFVEVAASRPGTAPPGLAVRVLGSIVAHIEGGPTSSPFFAKEDGASIDVKGAFSTFTGWSSWLVVGQGARAISKVLDDAAARSAWPELERPSLEGGGWKLNGPVEFITGRDLVDLAPSSQAIADRLAGPNALLVEKTVEAYRRPTPPELAATLANPATAINQGPNYGQLNNTNTAAGTWTFPASASPGSQDVVELNFDAQAMPWKGDLAAFLRDSVGPKARLVRVLARGHGVQETGVVRAPDGTALEIVVEVPSAPVLVAGKAVEPLTWQPKADGRGDALIDVRGGHLALTRVRLKSKGPTGPEHLIRVEDGHLVLNQCVLTGAEGGGGRSLVLFRAAGTRDLPALPPLTLPAIDRPVCRIVDSRLHAGNEALTAELGRGFVSLTHSVVTSEGAAFTLRPEKVRRDRFSTDLALERCTVVAARSVVGFGKWPGADPGPDRPWLVSTKNCVFLDAFQRGNAPRQGVMLRLGDAEGLARGAVAWQSTGDVYDMAGYIAAGGATPARSDFKPNWLRIWGEDHVFGGTAPSRSDTKALVRLAGDRLKPGEFQPADLIVTAPANHGADLERMGIKPVRRP